MYDDNFPNVQTHAVKTKMVTVQHVVSEPSLQSTKIDEKQMENLIKQNLAIEMAKILLNENLVLFTKEFRHVTFDTVYRARCYLADKKDVAVIANIK
jgi:hypothetical protein